MNYTLDQMNLIDTYGTFHSTIAAYIFFLNAHGKFSGIDHTRHKTSLGKSEEIEVIPRGKLENL